MAESGNRLPAALLGIPAPLAVIATVAILAGFGLQRDHSSKGAADRTVAAAPCRKRP